MARAPRPEVDRWLQTAPDVDFPATKDEILTSLERAGAPDGVMEAIRAIPPEEYARRDEVTAAAVSEADDGRDPTVEAIQQRAKGRVAEPEREVTLPPLHDED